MTFSDLLLAEPILKAVSVEKYTTPSPIQHQAIPHLMAGKDVLGCAQTGTGKTAAFALPIVHRLYKNPNNARRRAPRALVLAPTRELAAQVGQSFSCFGRFANIKTTVIFGGVNQNPQVAALRAGVDVIVATPGRLVDLMRQGVCDLRSINTLVLDEADHMLDLGFIHDIKTVLKALPRERQTLLFSATMPKEIAALAATILRDPVKVSVAPVSSAVETVKQSLYHVKKADKGRLLVDIIQKDKVPSSLVFSRTKHGADKIMKMLNAAGIKAGAIHGNKTQNARRDALDSFKRGRLQVLVATDIAARGIDIQALPLVVNYDLPDVPETYVHRIGRTGRAGRDGLAVSFCDPEERSNLRDIERLTGQTIPTIQGHPFATAQSLPTVHEPRRAPAANQPRHNAGRRNAGPGRPGQFRSGDQDKRGGERGQKRRRTRTTYRKTA